MSVRVATASDAAFIDSLQKVHTHMVGWMPTRQLAEKINAQHVLIAEAGSPLGYVIAQDQYQKRDDVGIIYQVNVLPMQQRNLIGAMLVKAVFDRAAYGCRLFSCWCAQDIRANFFWESLGFVPLAFRTGSAAKQRIHIFWQRRIRGGDTTTPYWFPAQTGSGSLREDRLVLPIPNGVHWRDVMPIILPGMEGQPKVADVPKVLPGGAPVSPRPHQPKLSVAQKAAIHRSHSKHLQGVPLGKKAVLTGSGVKYVDRTDYVPETDAPDELITAEKIKPKRAPKPSMKNDPRLIAAAREMRDRWVEAYESGNLLLPENGTYDVCRAIASNPSASAPLVTPPAKALPNAA